MSSIASLMIGAPRGASVSLEEAPLALVGRNIVPMLWSSGFVASEIDRNTTEDGYPTFTFETSVAALRDRFGVIAKNLELPGSDYVSEAWAGFAILTKVLAELPADAPVVLEANEVAAMSDEGVLEEALVHQMSTFAELRDQWNPRLAASMTQTVRSDVLTGVLVTDRIRARRATGAGSDREGFFALLFGGVSGKRSSMIEEWLRSAPRAAPLKPLDEEARALLDELVSRHLVQVADEHRAGALQFLEMAARYRTAAALQEILDVLFAQRVLDVGKIEPSAWRDFDQIVALNQADEVPVFDAATLGAVVGVLGD